MCITLTPSLAMIQKIHTRLRTRVYHERSRMAPLVNPPTCCPVIHITLIQTNARCALGTGTGTKVHRSPGTASKNCLTLLVILHFHRLPFLKPDGVPSMKNSAGITLMETCPSGWVKTMAGSAHRLQYRCRFIVVQSIQVVKTTLFKGSTTVHSFLLCEKKYLIPHTQRFFTTNHTNCDGIRLIGTMT